MPRALWRHLGDLSGKRVLLVGNGGHAQELFFLTKDPELLVFSDLSAAGVVNVRERFDLRPYQDRVWFVIGAPRSPEDVRDTMEGGFREEPIARRIRELGAEPWFERLSLACYVWRRATLVLLPQRVARCAEHPRIAGPLIRFDEKLARRPRAQRHLMRLIWGLDKPA